jgi:hypothetical protein
VTFGRRCLTLTVLVAVLMSACGGRNPGSDPVIDGWPVGVLDECPGAVRGTTVVPPPACTAGLALYTAMATAAYDRRNPDHPQIVRMTVHLTGKVTDSLGRDIYRTSESHLSVAVFELADGGVRAIGIGHVGVDPRLITVDYGLY